MRPETLEEGAEMRWIKVGMAVGGLCGAALVSVTALGAGPVAAATRLTCTASVSVAHPAHGQHVDVLVRTVKGAWVGAIAHFKTGSVKKSTHANSAGRAKLVFGTGNAAYGVRVAVNVYVDKAGGKGRCVSSFTPTAPPKVYRISSCRASGDYATCDEAGNAKEPTVLTVHVTAGPNQSVLVSWDDVCSEGDSAASTSGQFTARTPIDRTIRHPFAHPDSCTVAAGAQLNGGGSLHVWTDYEK
jgi:hypothetical protein